MQPFNANITSCRNGAGSVEIQASESPRVPLTRRRVPCLATSETAP